MKRCNKNTIATNNGLGVTNVYLAYNGPDGLEDPDAKGYLIDGLHPNSQGAEVIDAQFRNLNSFILAKDTDGDGYNNGREKYIGTNILASCPTSSPQHSWPPDLINDGRITIADVSAEVQKYNTTLPRYDLNQDGRVTMVDILIVRSSYPQTCKP